MKREIKFRGRSLDGEWWQYGYYWIEPEYDYDVTGRPIIEIGHTPMIDGTEVQPDTIGQMTGIKDVDGKDVYEGDIVQFTKCESITGEVVWNETQAAFTLKLDMDERAGTLPIGEWITEGQQFKVIGNIHDKA